jgi:hypothetical protein
MPVAKVGVDRRDVWVTTRQQEVIDVGGVNADQLHVKAQGEQNKVGTTERECLESQRGKRKRYWV